MGADRGGQGVAGQGRAGQDRETGAIAALKRLRYIY